MAWCHQATSHYLSQGWPRSMSPYGVTRPQWVKITAASPSEWVNSLSTGRSDWNFRWIIFKLILVIDGRISCEIILRWISPDVIDDKSTLVQVMAWCCQATSHYLSQCWRRSMSTCFITRPQWVKKEHVVKGPQCGFMVASLFIDGCKSSKTWQVICSASQGVVKKKKSAWMLTWSLTHWGWVRVFCRASQGVVKKSA